MLDFFFHGLFNTDISGVISFGDFLLCMGCSLLIGLILAFSCRYQCRYTKSFLVTLTLLPAVVCVIIMMVNGSVGAGVAVAGSFSLVRFRSAPGTGREITMLFLAMGAGLIAGMGYLAFALLFTLIMSVMNVVYNHLDFGEKRTGERYRTLSIMIPESLDYDGVFDDRMSQKPSDVQSTAVPTEETNSVSAKGIKTGSLVIDGGSFTIDAADDGLHADRNLTLQGGALTISSGDDGLHADETVMISAGSINILKSYEGIEGNHVMVQGGEITLTATDDGLNAAGGRDGSGFGMRGDSFNQSGDTSSIVISGGTVNVTASGDGIDANGTLEISGGTVTVSGPTYGDTSVLDYDLSGIISGGTFIGTGSSSMAQTFSESGQGVISVNAGSQNADTQITLADSSGTVILSYTPALSFEIVILSDPSIHAGESYTLSIGSSTQIFTAK